MSWNNLDFTVPAPPYLWSQYHNAKGTWPTHETVPDADLRDKWILISGGNSGIGREASLQFAKWGANIIIAARDPPPHEIHPNTTVQDCLAAAKAAGHVKSHIEWWTVDYSSLSTIRQLADRWLQTGRPLDYLINNAGMGRSASITTKDGFQLIYQVNFLGHTLMTLLLLPALVKAKKARIVCVTSCMHYMGQFDLAATNAIEGPGYANSKLLFQTFVGGLYERLRSNPKTSHIDIVGIHPGYVNSGIWEAARSGDPSTLTILGKLLLMGLQYYAIDNQQGSLAITAAATRAKQESLYYNRIWPDTPMPQSVHRGCQDAVWKMVHDKLDLKEDMYERVL